MRIIQSFWSGRHKDIQNNYGWASYEYHWMSWMLSVHRLREYYNEVELYTDSFGRDILIEKLKLPYTKVHVVLDELNDLPDALWAMAKIKVYSLQTEPFLHVDGDVFIWEKFPENLLKSGLITQNQEITTSYYREMWSKISPDLTFLPAEMIDFHKGRSNLAHNMGIFGGNDVDFIRSYSHKALTFVFNNKSSWEKINLFNFNIFFEQVLFCECSKIEDKKVGVLITEDIGDNSYEGFGDFDSVPDQKTYLHLLGVFKQSEFVCRKMEQYVFSFYPQFIRLLKTLASEKYSNFNFGYTYALSENKTMKSEYKKRLFLQGKKNLSKEKSNLFARDLYTQNQLRKLKMFEKHKVEYSYLLLPEHEIREESEDKLLYVNEINGCFFVKKLNAIDQIILDQLSKPITKESLFKSMMTYLDEDFEAEDIVNLNNAVYQTILHFIQLKLVIVIDADKKKLEPN
ncbi:DUF6734 family protein [uncultured Flavobacterium sp.]|uniref:DUF6734 family protein n=1 Tax=uncultured Flavobacterium sp. TaxID=165435 RepID=UPI002593E318|nr:DUF6734 family protein [uncultured Flavobacterium sp.]